MQRTPFPIFIALGAAACGGALDAMDAGAADIAAGNAQLLKVRRDERKCSAPACGGFWATPVRTSASPGDLADLDLSKAGLDATTGALVKPVHPTELAACARKVWRRSHPSG